MEGRISEDDRIASLERKVEAVSKASSTWWKDRLLVGMLGILVPATALAYQALNNRSLRDIEDKQQAFERALQLSRHYAEREAFAIKMASDAKLPDEKTRALEILSVLAEPIPDGDFPNDGRSQNAKAPQWNKLIAILIDRLASSVERGEFQDEGEIDRARSAADTASEVVDNTKSATSATKTMIAAARTILADETLRQTAFGNRSPDAGRTAPRPVGQTQPSVGGKVSPVKAAKTPPPRGVISWKSTPQAKGQLEPSVVQRIARAHVRQIRACYEAQLKITPLLSGKLTVNMTVGAPGRVMNAKVVEDTLGNPTVESCVLKDVRAWTFPSVTASSTITYPFVFLPAQETATQ